MINRNFSKRNELRLDDTTRCDKQIGERGERVTTIKSCCFRCTFLRFVPSADLHNVRYRTISTTNYSNYYSNMMVVCIRSAICEN